MDFLKDAWHILTTPGKELIAEKFAWWSWEAFLEFLEVGFLMFGLIVLILYALGARGKVAKCLYWDVALYFTLKILS